MQLSLNETTKLPGTWPTRFESPNLQPGPKSIRLLLHLKPLGGAQPSLFFGGGGWLPERANNEPAFIDVSRG